MTKVTINHEEIKRWVESKGGKPALIDRIQIKEDKVGLRVDFPGKGDESLLSSSTNREDITWEEFFRIFDEQHLAFSYEEEARGSDPTFWYRFEIRRNSI